MLGLRTSMLIAVCCLAAITNSTESEDIETSDEDKCILFDLSGDIIDGRVSGECYGLTELSNGGFLIDKNSNITLKAKEYLPEIPNNFKITFVMYLRKYYKRVVTFLSIIDECNNYILNITFDPSTQYLTIQVKNFNRRTYEVVYHISRLRKLKLHNLDIIFLQTGVEVYLGCKLLDPVTGKPRQIRFKETSTPRLIKIFTYADGNSSPTLDIFDLIISTYTCPPCERIDPTSHQDSTEDSSIYAKGIPGPAGMKGDTGTPGINGCKGEPGCKGDAGCTGSDGQKGATGFPGCNGQTGLPGFKGESGDLGPSGMDGIDGMNGINGIDGNKGDKGCNGLTGATGEKGEPGICFPGIKGENGQMGEKGADGIDGEPGNKGSDGMKGSSGFDGLPGNKGDMGYFGAPGMKGEIGMNGINGANGVDGQKGDTGQNGDNGDTGAIGPQGPKGEIGPVGPPVLSDQSKDLFCKYLTEICCLIRNGGKIDPEGNCKCDGIPS